MIGCDQGRDARIHALGQDGVAPALHVLNAGVPGADVDVELPGDRCAGTDALRRIVDDRRPVGRGVLGRVARPHGDQLGLHRTN